MLRSRPRRLTRTSLRITSSSASQTHTVGPSGLGRLTRARLPTRLRVVVILGIGADLGVEHVRRRPSPGWHRARIEIERHHR